MRQSAHRALVGRPDISSAGHWPTQCSKWLLQHGGMVVLSCTKASDMLHTVRAGWSVAALRAAVLCTSDWQL